MFSSAKHRSPGSLKQVLSCFFTFCLCFGLVCKSSSETLTTPSIADGVKQGKLKIELFGDGQNTSHCQLVVIDATTGASCSTELKTVCISRRSLSPPLNNEDAKSTGLMYSIDPNPPKWAVGIIKSAKELEKAGRFNSLPIAPQRRVSTIAQLSIWQKIGGKKRGLKDAINPETVEAELLSKAHIDPRSLSGKEKATVKNRIDLICEAVDLTCKEGTKTEEEPDEDRDDREQNKIGQTTSSGGASIATTGGAGDGSALSQSSERYSVPAGTVFVANDQEHFQNMMCCEDAYIDNPCPVSERAPEGAPPCPPDKDPDKDCCIVRIDLTNDHNQDGSYEVTDGKQSITKTGTVKPGETVSITGQFGKCVTIKFRGGGNTFSTQKVCCEGLGEHVVKSKAPGLKGITVGAGNCDGDEGGDGPGKKPQSYGPAPSDKDKVPLGIYLKRDQDNWVPENPSMTHVTAQIFEKRNKRWVPSSSPREITFKFDQGYHSQEKGECLNSGKETTFDLFFDPAKNPTLIPLDQAAKYCSAMKTKNKVTRKTILVSCEDWGAFSRIAAEADGCCKLRRVGTELEECTDEIGKETEGCCLVSVPKDDNRNQIADGYEDPIPGPKPRAKDDKDEQPVGNGKPGDGFSAYEEYRGFRVRGISFSLSSSTVNSLNIFSPHIRTSWTIKDLFIHDRDRLTFGKYPAASGVACHAITAQQYDKSRVVNFNRGHATLHDQHGLLLVNMAFNDDTAGLSERGPPKNVKMVRIDKQKFQSGKTVFEGGLGSTTAHELGHATGIVHHNGGMGVDFDEKVSEIQPVPASGAKQPGVLYSTKGSIAGQKLPEKFWVGTKGNNTSGDPECCMTYSNKMSPRTVYEFGGDYEAVPKEAASISQNRFCSTKTGLLHNKDGHCAGNGKGAPCQNQIVVNDE